MSPGEVLLLVWLVGRHSNRKTIGGTLLVEYALYAGWLPTPFVYTYTSVPTNTLQFHFRVIQYEVVYSEYMVRWLVGW